MSLWRICENYRDDVNDLFLLPFKPRYVEPGHMFCTEGSIAERYQEVAPNQHCVLLQMRKDSEPSIQSMRKVQLLSTCLENHCSADNHDTRAELIRPTACHQLLDRSETARQGTCAQETFHFSKNSSYRRLQSAGDAWQHAAGPQTTCNHCHEMNTFLFNSIDDGPLRCREATARNRGWTEGTQGRQGLGWVVCLTLLTHGKSLGGGWWMPHVHMALHVC